MLKPCTLRYGNNKSYTPNEKGSWNLRGVKFQQPEGACWTVVMCVSPEEVRDTDFDTFRRTLEKVAGERCMRLQLVDRGWIDA